MSKTDKPRLAGVAIAAAVVLLIAGPVMLAVRPESGSPMYDPSQLWIALLLGPLAVLLFFRRRFAFIGILLCVLSFVSLIATILWLNRNARLPLFVSHAGRAFVFLGSAIVCFRRLYRSRGGPWILWWILGPVNVIYLMKSFAELAGSSFKYEQEVAPLCLSLALCDMLLYVGLFLLMIAFVAEPKGYDPLAYSKPETRPEPVREEPRRQQPVYPERPAEKEQPGETAVEKPSYQTAEYEILEDGEEEG